jgi:hypothetical protein
LHHCCEQQSNIKRRKSKFVLRFYTCRASPRITLVVWRSGPNAPEMAIKAGYGVRLIAINIEWHPFTGSGHVLKKNQGSASHAQDLVPSLTRQTAFPSFPRGIGSISDLTLRVLKRTLDEVQRESGTDETPASSRADRASSIFCWLKLSQLETCLTYRGSIES